MNHLVLLKWPGNAGMRDLSQFCCRSMVVICGRFMISLQYKLITEGGSRLSMAAGVRTKPYSHAMYPWGGLVCV